LLKVCKEFVKILALCLPISEPAKKKLPKRKKKKRMSKNKD
jgi:hypothetical protein